MKLKFPFNDSTVDVIVEGSHSERRGGSRKRRKKSSLQDPSEAEAVKMVSEKSDIPGTETTPIPGLKIDKLDTSEGLSDGLPLENKSINQPVLIVETENVVHNPFRQTEEIKVWSHS